MNLIKLFWYMFLIHVELMERNGNSMSTEDTLEND